jgi:hypothetical protein
MIYHALDSTRECRNLRNQRKNNNQKKKEKMRV